MADLKYDTRVLVDVVELKIVQCVLASGVKVLTEGSKDGVPVRNLIYVIFITRNFIFL